MLVFLSGFILKATDALTHLLTSPVVVYCLVWEFLSNSVFKFLESYRVVCFHIVPCVCAHGEQ